MPAPLQPGPTDRLSLRQVRSVFRLVGDARDQGDDPARWRPHVCQQLRRLTGAEIVVSSEVYVMRGRGATRVADVGWICEGPGTDGCRRIEQVVDADVDQFWLMTGNDPLAEADDEHRVPVKPTKSVHGGENFVFSQIALPHAMAVDQLGLHRGGGPPFTAATRKLVRLLHVELARFWRRDVLAAAKDAGSDLPPRLSQTLDGLLEGLSEKEIAYRLELSQHTVHNYVKALHQRYEVSSRGELLAKAAEARTGFRPKLTLELPSRGKPAKPAAKQPPVSR
ncbi:MAG: response regulator transcription factor [Phycisphaerae bacterium]